MKVREVTFCLLLAMLPAVWATSNLIAVSTMPGLLCGNSQTPRCTQPNSRLFSQSSLKSLVSHVSARTTHPDLPLAQTDVSPHLIVLVTSTTMRDPADLIQRVSTALNGASSFHASTDRQISRSDLLTLSARFVSSAEDLSSFALRGSQEHPTKGPPEIVNVNSEEQDSNLIFALRLLAEKTTGKLLVIWTVRDTGEVREADPADKPPEEPANKVQKSVNAPEINSAQVAGLLVTGMFLLIFVPGFMCLWNIQAPQSFEVFDGNDMKKKMQ